MDQTSNASFELEMSALVDAIKSEQAATPAALDTTATARESVHMALKEKISEILPPPPTSAPVNTPTDDDNKKIKKAPVGSKSYLDNVDDATVAKVNEYVARIFKNGIKHTIREVVEEDPFLLDVFHDALTDKLYNELVNRGLVKAK